MATIHLASIYEPADYIGTVYMMTVQGKQGFPDLLYKGEHLLTPTKAIVFGHKHYNGNVKKFGKWPKVDDEAYRARYLGIVEGQMDLIKEWYRGLEKDAQLTLCCYCPKGNFCHRKFVYQLFCWLNQKGIGGHTINLY